MGLYKKYRKKPNKPNGIDTTISNMMGYSGSGSTNMSSKDYGKIKSKGGLTKANQVVNKYPKNKKK